jgi:hypothetical protein
LQSDINASAPKKRYNSTLRPKKFKEKLIKRDIGNDPTLLKDSNSTSIPFIKSTENAARPFATNDSRNCLLQLLEADYENELMELSHKSSKADFLDELAGT